MKLALDFDFDLDEETPRRAEQWMDLALCAGGPFGCSMLSDPLRCDTCGCDQWVGDYRSATGQFLLATTGQFSCPGAR